MSLRPGTRVGPYEVVAAIGAGGMGEVFRARDSRLQRDVALKILPESFAGDSERLARFQREAQVLAALNCQNIAGIFGLEESPSGTALVLELVEGPTLADRLEAGAMPLDETAAAARQIADALETAHAQGIVHRDLKPANIKVRPDGTVKVLDFGLAKALDPSAGSSSDPLNSPTITGRATQLGIILGTAAYMAPEQARGKPVDKRADIWAFGCVLYEMLTGRRAFPGDDISDTLAIVLTREPDWAALPPDVPLSIRRLLRRCLEKDRKRRLADIADARLELDEVGATGGDVAHVAKDAVKPPAWRLALPWAIAGTVAAALVAVVVTWAPWRAQTPRPALRLSANIGADASVAITGLGTSSGPAVMISPRHNLLVFSARRAAAPRPSLWVRHLDQLSASELAGTQGGSGPFFSPDGQFIGFFADGKLKKIAVAGGAVSTLADAPIPRGAHWADDGTIYFSPDRASGIFAVPGSGGDARPITTFGPQEATHRNPFALPGGKALLYTTHISTSGFDDATIMVKELPDGSPRAVLRGGYYSRYLPSGHIVYVREGALHAVPFALDRLETAGTPVPVLDGIIASTLTGVAHFDLGSDGTAVYLAGPQPDFAGPIQWMNRDGTTRPLRATRSVTISVALSPDGQRLALDSYDGRQWDIWIYDWVRERLSRITDDGANDQRPVWTPDGSRIVFGTRQPEGDRQTYNLYWRRVDGSGSVQRLTRSGNTQTPGSWHPSGRFFAFAEQDPATSWDVMILPFDGDEASGWRPGTPTPFLRGRAAELEPVFSPDGRFVAYQSDESGRHEIYVRPFPGAGAREQVSSNGGTHPVWAPNGRDLLYMGEGRIMAAAYSTPAGTFVAEKPRPWSAATFNPRTGPNNRSYDLHPDGERVAFAALPIEETDIRRDQVVIIFNFFEELRRLAPAVR